VYGLAGQVRNIIDLMKREMGEPHVKVVATGGLSELVRQEENLIDIYDRRLSLNGLKIVYDLNK